MWINEELESAIDIVDLVGRYTSLKKAGANYKATCPFPWHNEKTPSFIVSPTKQLAYCFGCHKWWGVIKFVMDIENCEYREAVEILWNYAWIKVNTNFNQEKYEQKKSMYSLYKDTANYYKESLKKNPEIKKYLFDRWMNDDIIRDFNIWYSDSWIELYSYLKNKWYSDEQIDESKIFLDIKTKRDKFINRIIFPIQNGRWDFVAFAWRVYWAWEPKYLNSPASSFYDKSNILYNLFNARTAITKEDYVIISEGYMDAIALTKWWFNNVVAVSWTALTDKHISLLKRLTKKIYICFDWDWAWEKATRWAIEKMKNAWVEVKIIMLPNWKDPDDIIKSWKDFKEYIDNALSPIWYYIKKAKFDKNSIEEKKALLLTLLDIIKSYSNHIEREIYLREISETLDLSEKLVFDSYNNIKYKNHEQNTKDMNIKKEVSSADLAIAYCVLDEENTKFFKENLAFYEWMPKSLKEVFEKWIQKIESFELSKKEKYRGLALKIEIDNEVKNADNISKDLQSLARRLDEEIYNKEKVKYLSSSDKEDLVKYIELNKIAKKAWIK